MEPESSWVFICLYRSEKVFLKLGVHKIVCICVCVCIYIVQKAAGLGVEITDKQGNKYTVDI
jgi:hypothetical protein